LLFVVADKLYKPVSNIRAGTRSVKIRFFYIFFRLVECFRRAGPAGFYLVAALKKKKREREREEKKKGGKIARTRENEDRLEKERKVRTPCITVSF